MQTEAVPYRLALRVHEQGRVRAVGDGVAWVTGLPSAALDQMVVFAEGERGLVFHLRHDEIGVVLLDEPDRIAAGAPVRLAAKRLTVPSGDALAGRVVDPLGRAVDGGGVPACDGEREIDVLSPPMTSRAAVRRPLYTGTKIVDAMLPIGRGQRQLLIGDRGTGKTAFAIDAVVNQHNGDVRCVYVLTGRRRSDVVNVIETLRDAGTLPNTTVVVAEASAPPGLQYLAPFSGCAIAEAWVARGEHVLVVYDDLTRHAQAYRSLSLLLRRPPGREAYPGDVFYLHSRLLERATCMAPEYGGGSLTAFPIIETEEGEIAAYIPTNLISITDGQLVFDPDLASAGMLPAIDVTRSVSRIGGKAQVDRMRAEAGRMRLDYLQFLELERFTRFGTRLEATTEAKIARGRVLRELLKQERLAPVSPEFQVAWLVAYNDGAFDATPPEAVGARLASLAAAVRSGGAVLDWERERWSAAVKAWLGDADAA